MNKLQHTIRLCEYDFDNGTIPFTLLNLITSKLTSMSKKVTRLFIEGYSDKKGKTPDWLSESVDFYFAGIKSGSTILEMEAPKLGDIINGCQGSMFQDNLDINLNEETALTLAMRAMDSAMNNELDTPLLNSDVLKEMNKFSNVFIGANTYIEINGSGNKLISINKEKFKNFKEIAKSSPKSQKIFLSGTLDEMKHSVSKIGIVTQNKTLKAYLSDNVNMSEAREHFGHQITIEGIANFNTAGNITSIEVSAIRRAEAKDKIFEIIPKAHSQKFNIGNVFRDERKKPIEMDKFNRLIHEISVEETSEELLQLLR